MVYAISISRKNQKIREWHYYRTRHIAILVVWYINTFTADKAYRQGWTF